MIEFLSAFSWPHTIPLMVIIICLIFRKPIAAKIREISWLRGEGKKYDISFNLSKEKPQQAIPDAGETVITQDDVLQAFKKIPDLKEDEIKKHLKETHEWLLRNNIITKRQLNALVSSDMVLDTLRTLYIEELLRPKDAPLDPVAVAAWGANLFNYGVTDNVVSAIRRKLRQSIEYKQKHARLGSGL